MPSTRSSVRMMKNLELDGREESSPKDVISPNRATRSTTQKYRKRIAEPEDNEEEEPSKAHTPGSDGSSDLSEEPSRTKLRSKGKTLKNSKAALTNVSAKRVNKTTKSSTVDKVPRNSTSETSDTENTSFAEGNADSTKVSKPASTMKNRKTVVNNAQSDGNPEHQSDEKKQRKVSEREAKPRTQVANTDGTKSGSKMKRLKVSTAKPKEAAEKARPAKKSKSSIDTAGSDKPDKAFKDTEKSNGQIKPAVETKKKTKNGSKSEQTASGSTRAKNVREPKQPNSTGTDSKSVAKSKPKASQSKARNTAVSKIS